MLKERAVPASSNLQAQYTYDVLGNLTNVLKCTAGSCGSGQSRAFLYDSQSRLLAAQNPESGTYTYSYSNGSTSKLALQVRTDPRGYTTTYGYDLMDKILSIKYNDGTPNGTYTYNANGQLTQSSNSNVTNDYLTFDGNGRVLTSDVKMGGVTYPFSYSYDAAGDLTQETYPSGRQLNFTYDLAQRPLTVNGVSAGTTTKYVQSVGYYPHGAPQFWQYGNGLYCWQNVNKMLTSWETWATQNNNGNNWMFVAYNGFDNSENVISQTEGFGTGVPWNNLTFLNGQFQYDNLSRLFSVTDTNYKRTYNYDEFGNQSIQSYTGISPVGFAPQNSGGNPFNPATNHLVTVDAASGYDARGMVTKLGPGGTVQMAYDAEGNMKNTSDTNSGQSLSWVFDAEGQRAQKLISGGSWTLYVHDAFGQLAASYNNNGVTPACATCYLTYDMLGSPRLITDPGQNVVARHDFIPFGEEIPNGVAGRNGNFASTSNVTRAFTGQEADGSTAALDFYNARHFSAVMGSFMQPDPANAGADILNPQSWNGYGYVLGNPLGLVDPSGMTSCNAANNYCSMKRPSNQFGNLTPFGSGNLSYISTTTDLGESPSTSSEFYSFYDSVAFLEPVGADLDHKLHVPAKTGKTCPAVPQKPPSVDLSYIMNLNSQLNYTGWYNAVKNRGIWDFKQIRNLDDFGVPLKQSQYEDFGNWNFGLTAGQQRIPRQIALRGAGWAGQRAIGKNFLSALGTALSSSPYGDDPADQKQINAGYDYYVSHCY